METNMTLTFEVGKEYIMHSPCDWDCLWKYEVINRTAKTITLQDEYGKIKKCRTSIFMGVESCKPLGSYSMSPILSAEKLSKCVALA